MWKNYLITAWRNMQRNPLYAVISIGGLAIGFAVALLCLAVIWQETHYDNHVPALDRLFLVETTLILPGRDPQILPSAPGPLAPALREVSPAVESVGRLWMQWSTVKVDDRLQFNTVIGGIDPEFLDLFPIEIITGDAANLSDPASVLLSRSMAERIFGMTSVVGESLQIDGAPQRYVAAVFKDWPRASHLDLEVLVPIDSRLITSRGVDNTSWNNPRFQSYVRLHDAADAAIVDDTANSLAVSNMPVTTSSAGATARPQDYISISLEPVQGIHLNGKDYSSAGIAMTPPGNPTELLLLGTVGILVLLMASANHVNLATVRGYDRAREVSLRKVAGAKRHELVQQFIAEAAVLGMIALGIAMLMVETARQPLGDFLRRSISLAIFSDPWLVSLVVTVVTTAMLAAGAYPALMLSRYRPLETASKQAGRRQGPFNIRAVLIVFQFTVSIGLITAGAVVWQQIRYTDTADPGFDPENIVVLYGVGRQPEQTIQLTRALEEAIRGHPAILAITGSDTIPSWDWNAEVGVRRQGEQTEEPNLFSRMAVGLEFFETYGIKPVAGRSFSADFGQDRAQWDYAERHKIELPVVLNRTALRRLRFEDAEAAVGQPLELSTGDSLSSEGRIVGIVDDFHLKSMRFRIEPMIIYPDPAAFSAMSVRIDPARQDEAIKHIKAGWAKVLPDQSSEPEFLENAIKEQYSAEGRQLSVIGLLSGLAVLIAALGLYGLTALAVRTRTTEIAVRKILGARNTDLLRLLLWQFTRPVILANFIAWPVAAYFALRWLDQFVYRIDLTPWPFLLAGGTALAIALLTVSGHALRVARTHPALALREE